MQSTERKQFYSCSETALASLVRIIIIRSFLSFVQMSDHRCRLHLRSTTVNLFHSAIRFWRDSSEVKLIRMNNECSRMINCKNEHSQILFRVKNVKVEIRASWLKCREVWRSESQPRLLHDRQSALITSNYLARFAHAWNRTGRLNSEMKHAGDGFWLIAFTFAVRATREMISSRGAIQLIGDWARTRNILCSSVCSISFRPVLL